MPLLSCYGQNFRLLDDFKLDLCTGINTFIGPNAAGKTSLLEALVCLATSKSFRGHSFQDVVKRDKDFYLLTGIVNQLQQQRRLGIQRHRDKTLVKIDGKPQKTLSQYITVLPCSVIHPESTNLFTGPGSERRRFLDWSMFHVEHYYVERLRLYNRSLIQRNAALKQQTHDLATWTQKLVQQGNVIHNQRVQYFEKFKSFLLKNELLRVLPEFEIR